MSILTLGLTGGIASGKSTVARWLAEAGFTVVDADLLVADLYRPGQAGALAVAEIFGKGVLAEDRSVDHAALASRVFKDKDALLQLEAAIHPLVRLRFAEIAREINGVAVLEATRLVEAGYAPDFDLVVTVEADAATRLERAVARGHARTDAEARMKAQGNGDERRATSDWTLENNLGLEELRTEVDALIAEVERQRADR